MIPIVNGALGTIHKKIRRTGKQRRTTERSPEDLRRRVVTLNPMIYHQLKLAGKNSQGVR